MRSVVKRTCVKLSPANTTKPILSSERSENKFNSYILRGFNLLGRKSSANIVPEISNAKAMSDAFRFFVAHTCVQLRTRNNNHQQSVHYARKMNGTTNR